MRSRSLNLGLATAALLSLGGLGRVHVVRKSREPSPYRPPAYDRPRSGAGVLTRRLVTQMLRDSTRSESTRERVRHAARRDGLLLHQVLADDELVARYGAEGLRRAS